MAIRSKRARLEHKQEQSVEVVADRFPFRHPLDTGDRGALVLWAQSKLTETGHYTGPLDGRFDRDVALAVRDFQQAHQLMVTGVIDRKTWNALQP